MRGDGGPIKPSSTDIDYSFVVDDVGAADDVVVDDDCVPTTSLSTFTSRAISSSAWDAFFSPSHHSTHSRMFREHRRTYELHLVSSDVWLIIQPKPAANIM